MTTLNEYLELNAFVQKARKALETDSVKGSMENLKNFPLDGCGDASLLLGNALKKAGFKGYNIVYGEVDDVDYKSHAWLENDTFLIDITADQFKEAGCCVILSKVGNVNEYMGFISKGPGSLELGFTAHAWPTFRTELELQGVNLAD